jgi:CheY-like chemotaxis protein
MTSSRAETEPAVAGPQAEGDNGQQAVGCGSVLVIDDEPGIREVVRLILESRGLTVVTAGSTAEARRRLAERRPGAILLDLVLPGEDGLTFLASLKADRRYAAIPVLVITGRLRRGDRARAVAAGAEDLFTKPFDEHAVLSWLAAHRA